MTILEQLRGPFFQWTLIGLVLLDIVSFFTLHSLFEPLALLALAVFFIVVAIRHPDWLFPLALAEVIATSNGHSLNVELFGASIGLRIVLFSILIAATAIRCVRQGKTFLAPHWYFMLGIIGLVLGLGVLNGWAAGHSWRNIYLDANGYVSFLYIWAAFVWVRTAMNRHRLLQAFSAGVAWITAKTLLFVLLFAHLHPKTLAPINAWIRDTRLGELTMQFEHVYRVFLQSQWFIVIAVLLLVAYIVFVRTRDSASRVLLIPLFAAFFISLSRSFWVGAAIGGLVLFTIFLLTKHFRTFLLRVPEFVAIKIASVCLLFSLIAVPIFGIGAPSFGGLFTERVTQTNDVALDSRRQLLGPLHGAIAEAPVSGHGLGATVVYETQDPKYIEAHNTNIVSTYAFEWGWHDILVKFGIVGTLMIAMLLWLSITDLWRAFKEDPARRWLYGALMASIVSLAVVHVFSPYLNHPIGWMTIAFVVAFIPQTAGQKERSSLKVPSTVVSSPQAVLSRK